MTKSYIIIIAIALIVLTGIGAFQHFIKPDGTTLESREELLGELPKGADWKIAVEQDFSNFIISGIYSRDGKSGIAVFELIDSGKYKLYSREWREQDDIVITGITSQNMWYDIVWFNGAKTDYAEITYSVDGKIQEPIIHNAKDMEIFINPAPAKDYSMNVVYYDSEGNKYE